MPEALTPEPVRPIVVASRCLGFEACRWNGVTIDDPIVASLRAFVEFHTVCPECEIGLGVPREPIRLVRSKGETDLRLMQPATGRDVTDAMRDFAASFLDGLGEIDGFLFKGRSPSCGPRQVKIYKDIEKGAHVDWGSGLFAAEAAARYPDLPLEEEGRLANFAIREHFFTRLWTLARFRAVKHEGGMGSLVRFHSENKYLFMTYSPIALRLMGRIVANHAHRPPEEVIALYEVELRKGLRKPPRFTSNINVLEHAAGYVSDRLTPGEKKHFRAILRDYREGRKPLSVCQTLVRSWAIRFDVTYLLEQTYFAPYPEALVEITDSGKGRDR